MSDSEKIQKMVSWMGGWPEHDWIRGDSGRACTRCRHLLPKAAVQIIHECHGWNPFERIEDAFLVVERLNMNFVITFSKESRVWLSAFGPNMLHENARDTPARAIAEAAWQVIQRLGEK